MKLPFKEVPQSGEEKIVWRWKLYAPSLILWKEVVRPVACSAVLGTNGEHRTLQLPEIWQTRMKKLLNSFRSC